MNICNYQLYGFTTGSGSRLLTQTPMIFSPLRQIESALFLLTESCWKVKTRHICPCRPQLFLLHIPSFVRVCHCFSKCGLCDLIANKLLLSMIFIFFSTMIVQYFLDKSQWSKVVGGLTVSPICWTSPANQELNQHSMGDLHDTKMEVR